MLKRTALFVLTPRVAKTLLLWTHDACGKRGAHMGEVSRKALAPMASDEARLFCRPRSVE